MEDDELKMIIDGEKRSDANLKTARKQHQQLPEKEQLAS